MEHGGIVKLGDWINQGWNLYSKAWKTWTLMGAIAMLPMIMFLILFYISYIAFLLSHPDPRSMGAGSIVTMLVLFACSGLFIFLYGAFAASGMYLAAMKQIRGEVIEVSDIWKGGRYVIPMTLLYIVNTFLICVGAILCFFPAFIVQGLVFLSYAILIHENCGPIEAVQKSWNLAKKDWVMFMLFALVVGMISQIGSYACLVGIFFTFPLHFTMAAAAYRDCFESAVSSGSMKACRNCGKVIPKDVNFCNSCGASQV